MLSVSLVPRCLWCWNDASCQSTFYGLYTTSLSKHFHFTLCAWHCAHNKCYLSRRSERYLGMWQEDKYHGAGILVAENQFYYSGMFANGERNVSELGIMILKKEDYQLKMFPGAINTNWACLFEFIKQQLSRLDIGEHSRYGKQDICKI